MKKLFGIAVLLCTVEFISAQTFAEWFRQTETQKKYLLQQIAALQVYSGYLAKGYAVAKQGLNTIQRIKHGDFNLHSNYFTSLVTVNPRIKGYTKVADIISLQINIAKQIAKTFKDCKNSHQLTSVELNYLQKIFDALLNDCSKCLDALFIIISDGQLSMKDDERIVAIDKIYIDMADKQIFIRAFSNTSKGLCIQRENDQRDIIISKKLNGL
ncbi:MAG: hypothetical protein J0H85_02990 [Sediminibacterium magnilacihabitans]|nr:hypothetical protein [Sediminibacterium magnilacihabitans]